MPKKERNIFFWRTFFGHPIIMYLLHKAEHFRTPINPGLLDYWMVPEVVTITYLPRPPWKVPRMIGLRRQRGKLHNTTNVEGEREMGRKGHQGNAIPLTTNRFILLWLIHKFISIHMKNYGFLFGLFSSLDYILYLLCNTRESYVNFFPETQLLFWSSLSHKGIAQYLDTKIW